MDISTGLNMPLWMIWACFGAIFLIVTITSLVLNYHWKAYGMNYDQISKAKKVYYSGVVILLGGGFLFGLLITF